MIPVFSTYVFLFIYVVYALCVYIYIHTQFVGTCTLNLCKLMLSALLNSGLSLHVEALGH